MKNLTTSPRWWDWSSVGLLFVLIQITVSRLVTTEWTDFLNLTQIVATMGLIVGLALGYSQFTLKRARWVSFWYMVVILPLIWIRIIDKQVDVEERFLSIGGRLLASINQLFNKAPIDDPLFFVAVMCVAFWIASASAGFQLTRKQNFVVTVVPAAVGIMVIQHYDNAVAGRLWILGMFAFVALCLLGRLNFLQNQQKWRISRIFISPENKVDISSSMAIAAGFIIVSTLLLPSKFPQITTIRESWREFTRPWTEFTNDMENAVSALDSTTPGTPTSFYGTELQLGLGFPLSDAMMFRVQAPELGFDQQPPRYYWRGRTYDYFSDGQWYTTGTARSEFSPVETNVQVAGPSVGNKARFIFTLGTSQSALLYSPAQPIWFSRPGSYLATSVNDIFSWNVSPTMQPGETYQVDAMIKNPHVEELREAGSDYPQWVLEKYVQMPAEFSPRIQQLARDITANEETDYDKAVAITRYLRDNIEYAPILEQPPRRADPLEWVMFESRKAYCVYYATAEIMMLRSVGIPARMAVGFAQGNASRATSTGETDETSITLYTVIRKNAHAWPEVYFPDIGWVEFEPTGNQNQLNRPFLPVDRDNTNDAAFINRNTPLLDDAIPTPPEQVDLPSVPTQEPQRFSPTFYLILILIIFTPLTVFVTHRYQLSARMPSLVRTTIERTGFESPAWVIRWERWVTLSPVERSFESINSALRRIRKPQPIHATPVERAEMLAITLPNLKPVIKVLLDEHQTSLYTSRIANASKARQAAFQITTQSLLAIVRHFMTGQYHSTSI